MENGKDEFVILRIYRLPDGLWGRRLCAGEDVIGELGAFQSGKQVEQERPILVCIQTALRLRRTNESVRMRGGVARTHMLHCKRVAICVATFPADLLAAPDRFAK